MIRYLDHLATAASVPLKTHRVGGGVIRVKSVEAPTSSRLCGMKVRRSGTSSGVVLVAMFDPGSKLQGMSSKALQ
ncbi:hypothetical protein TNCV_4013131 [Trichonephila clavipes]|nr:hypothetical protein TNCV_4013131 [Trichonephila clavipes]